MTLSHKVFDACLVAHNMRFWCFLSFYSPVCTRPEKNVSDRYTCKISDLGSNVCGTVLIWSVFFHLFSLKSMPGVKPVYFSGGHSIWVNVRCYFMSCKEKMWKEKSDLHDWCNLITARYVYGFNCSLNIFIYFLQCSLFQSPKERCSKIDVAL